ncbi:inovirus Gp2 family protein, partial [Escherichia coli]|nr:inovirus Gp2 family protein [Escherichia coli]
RIRRIRTVVSINHTGASSPYLSVPQDDFCIVNPGGCIVHFPANGRDIQDINAPDFPEQYQRLLARLDYLT